MRKMLNDPNEIASPATDGTCPDCRSRNVIQAEYGSVCGDCGCVIDDLVLDGSSPRGREGPIRQSEIYRSHLPTRVGLPREQLWPGLEGIKGDLFIRLVPKI